MSMKGLPKPSMRPGEAESLGQPPHLLLDGPGQLVRRVPADPVADGRDARLDGGEAGGVVTDLLHHQVGPHPVDHRLELVEDALRDDPPEHDLRQLTELLGGQPLGAVGVEADPQCRQEPVEDRHPGGDRFEAQLPQGAREGLAGGEGDLVARRTGGRGQWQQGVGVAMGSETGEQHTHGDHLPFREWGQGDPST
jgi:hypothetical protein